MGLSRELKTGTSAMRNTAAPEYMELFHRNASGKCAADSAKLTHYVREGHSPRWTLGIAIDGRETEYVVGIGHATLRAELIRQGYTVCVDPRCGICHLQADAGDN